MKKYVGLRIPNNWNIKEFQSFPSETPVQYFLLDGKNSKDKKEINSNIIIKNEIESVYVKDITIYNKYYCALSTEIKFKDFDKTIKLLLGKASLDYLLSNFNYFELKDNKTFFTRDNQKVLVYYEGGNFLLVAEEDPEYTELIQSYYGIGNAKQFTPTKKDLLETYVYTNYENEYYVIGTYIKDKSVEYLINSYSLWKKGHLNYKEQNIFNSFNIELKKSLPKYLKKEKVNIDVLSYKQTIINNCNNSINNYKTTGYYHYKIESVQKIIDLLNNEITIVGA